MAFGGFGMDILTSSFTPKAGTVYGSIYFKEETQITMKNLLPAGTQQITSVTFPAGETIYGSFANVSVASGSATGYIKEYVV